MLDHSVKVHWSLCSSLFFKLIFHMILRNFLMYSTGFIFRSWWLSPYSPHRQPCLTLTLQSHSNIRNRNKSLAEMKGYVLYQETASCPHRGTAVMIYSNRSVWLWELVTYSHQQPSRTSRLAEEGLQLARVSGRLVWLGLIGHRLEVVHVGITQPSEVLPRSLLCRRIDVL